MARITIDLRLALGVALMSVAALASGGTLPMPSARADSSNQATPSLERADAMVLAAASGADYDMGYRDGLGNQAYRDKDRSNKAYGDGYKAGQEQRRSGAAIPAGSDDYQLGYRDGYGNQAYRDKDRSNKAYGEGFKAGQEQRRSGAGAPGGNADFQLGYRDGYDRQPYRDKDRSNKSYGDGFKTGQTDRERGVSSTQRPVTTAAAGRPRGLVGRNADNLETDMQAIGYSWRAGEMKGRESHTTWRGASDSQCVRAVVRNGKVATMTDVAASNCR
jgi:hypothetical protein